MAIYRGIGSASSTSDNAVVDDVTTQATNAASSASAAATSASQASTSASSASTSATSAASSESTASTAATTATTAATAAETAQTAAETAQTAAETAETNAESSATSAASSASSASTSASNASTSETNAATSETNAATSATNAATSETNAATSETNAASSATAAQTAQTAAETAQAAAEAAQEAIDGLYLGAQTSDPTLDNNGDPITAGDWYYNTVTAVTRIYDGSVWQNGAVSTAGFALTANNLSDLASASTARTNLGLGTAATTASTDYATAAQGTLADSAVQPSDNISTLTNDSGYITGYTVTEGDVTAHQAALSITESQISDLGTYVDYTATTGSAVIPSGTEAQRDGTPQAGYFRFNSDTGQFEGYDGTQWGAIAGGSGGGAGLQDIFLLMGA